MIKKTKNNINKVPEEEKKDDKKNENDERIRLNKECEALIKEIQDYNQKYELEIKDDDSIDDLKNKKQTLVGSIQTIKTELNKEITDSINIFKNLGKNIANIDYNNKTIKEIIEFKVDLEKEKDNLYKKVLNNLSKIKNIEAICEIKIYDNEVKKDDKLDDLIKKNKVLDDIYNGNLKEIFEVYDKCNDEKFLEEISEWVSDITKYNLYNSNQLRNFSELFNYKCEYEKLDYGSTEVKSIKFICENPDNEKKIEKLYCKFFEISREKSKEKGDDKFSELPYCGLIEFIKRYDKGGY